MAWHRRGTGLPDLGIFDRSEEGSKKNGTVLWLNVIGVDSGEMLKEMQSIVGGSYQAALSNDMNSIMKVLTIIATIFIPLTFVAGIYGMNFQHMPELSLPWAYPVVLGVMGAILVGMLIFFRRKGWL